MKANVAAAEAIDELLGTYISNPLLLLREQAWQGRLISLIQGKLTRKMSMATVKPLSPKMPKGFSHVRSGDMERTQPEVGCSSVLGPRQAIDVVVLGARVNLTCYPHGPQDIVRTLDVLDLEVAIEIKSSPSRNAGQRSAYLADIHKLNLIKTSNPNVECHFVLLDTSEDVKDVGYQVPQTWSAGTPATASLAKRGRRTGVWVWTVSDFGGGYQVSVSHHP